MNAISRQSRVPGIDAARGTAMALVCLSHVKEHFVESAPAVYWVLINLTRIATPTFLLLSGFVIGYVLRNSTRPYIRLSFVDRGLFLLLVAHWLIGLADLKGVSVADWVFNRALIVDAIGISVLVGVCVRGASAGALVTAGIALAACSWVIGMTLDVQSPGWRRVADLLFHLRSNASALVDVAFAPYLGMFLIGMAMSRTLDAALKARNEAAIARRFAVVGGTCVLAALLGGAVWHWGKEMIAATGLESHSLQLLRQTLDPRFKWPPSPAYFMLYGGAGMLIAATFLWQRPSWIMQPFTRFMAVPGRAALMCFVAQDWLLRLAPELLGFNHLESTLFWFAYLGSTLVLLYWLSLIWDRNGANRWLTIGLRPLADRYGAAGHAWLGALHVGSQRITRAP